MLLQIYGIIHLFVYLSTNCFYIIFLYYIYTTMAPKIAPVAFGKCITERGLHILLHRATNLSQRSRRSLSEQKWAGSRVKGQARIGNYV